MTTDYITHSDQATTSGTPLRKFRGKLVDITKRMDSQRQGRDGQQGREVVDLDFSDMNVLESLTPYNYPAFQLTINYSASDRGAWAMLLKSSEELGVPNVNDLKSKTLLMECDPRHHYGENRDGEAITGMVWYVREVGGGDAPALSADAQHEHILNLLDGKDQTGFAQAALQDSVVRAMQITSQISDNSLVSSLIASGEIEERDGKYYKKG